MRLFIDEDDSPVKEDITKLGESYGLGVVIVTNMDHYTTKEYTNHVQIVYVDHGADSADYKIVGIVKKSDLLITQDYDLASLILPKGVRMLHHSGKEFDEANIGTLLEQHYHSGKLGEAGIRIKDPKPFTEKDHMPFRQTLKKVVD